MLIVLLALLAASCSPGAPASQGAVAEPPEAVESPVATPAAASGGQSLVDSEELIGLGELGLLPSLLQTFGAGIDCDFDDAFSTCQ